MINTDHIHSFKNFGSALVELSGLNADLRLTSAMKDQIQILEYELESLAFFIFCFTTLNDSSFGKKKDSGVAEISRFHATLKKQQLLQTGLLALESREFEDWDTLSSELLENIHICKVAAKEDCFHFLDCLSQFEFSGGKLRTLMRGINLYQRRFLHLNGDLISDEKAKIESLKADLALVTEVFQFRVKRGDRDMITVSLGDILESFEDFLFTKDSESDEEIEQMENCDRYEQIKYLSTRIQAWACNAACLCLLSWVLEEKDENMSSTKNVILSDLQQKLNTALQEVCKTACLFLLNWVQDEREENLAASANVIVLDLLLKLNSVLPEVTRMCLAVLKASKPSEEERPLVGWPVEFVDFLPQKLQADLLEDDIQILGNGMIFLITFLMDPPEAEKYARDEKLILTQAAAAVQDAASLITLATAGEIEEGIAEKKNSLLHDFLTKVNVIKAEVRNLYAPLSLDSSSFDFPRINVLGFLDALIEKMKESSICNAMDQIVSLQDELVSLRNLLEVCNLKEHFISKLQDEYNELKDLWARIINVAYQAERTISSFMYLKCFVWLDMLHLFDVTEEIKHVVAEFRRIKDYHMHDIDALSTETNSSPEAHLQTNVPPLDEVVVGFQAEAEEILNWLKSEPRELDILSIIGMAGMGKTTLARKVYNDPSIKYHFIKCAWCTVSQSYNTKKVLLDILHQVTAWNDSFFEMEENDLADKLRICLIRRKYLVVIDDIWDVEAWNALKLSLPNDNNGSRIIFTSRIHNVVLEAKPDSRPYPLGLLSEEESWELLEKRLFHKDSCPSDFAEVGKQIAKDCKGLPLAVVLVSGLLKQKIDNLDWWKQMGENLGSRISHEGCVNLLEQSYKHLPEPLKPCFLYFGAFREDRVIRVQKLIELWISEGFVRKQRTVNSEIVAEQYLMDLVGRSLVMVTSRSSRGGIKACRVHDLLWNFCLAKAEEESFLKVVSGNDNSRVSSKALDKHYRVCIQSKDWSSFLFWNSSALHSLLFSPTATYHPLDMDYWSLSNPRFLQVLYLEDVKLVGGFPQNLTKLVLLRYISIHCTATSIPPKISELQNLETLRVKRIAYRFHLPDTIWRMEKLRHVHVGPCIPPPLHESIPALENIQSFSFPCLTFGEKAQRFLRTLPSVRKLRCEFSPILVDFHEMEDDNEIPDSIQMGEDQQVLELDFPNHLESLSMTCILRNLASCPFSFPLNLKKLKLKSFGMPWTEISTIAKLPNLEVLKLLVGAFTGIAWNMEDDDFVRLKFLKLQALDIEQWNASGEPFPCLEQLVVDGCRKLEEIPSAFGNIPTLTMIRVERCSSAVARSAEQIQEAQIELENHDFEVVIGRSSDGK